MADKGQLYVNGIDGITGEYLVAPMSYDSAVDLIRSEKTDKPAMRFLKANYRLISQPHLGLPIDIDPANVAQAGWGVVFHVDEDPTVKAALEPLIQQRQEQIGDDARVQVMEYGGEEDWGGWLARHGVAPGTVAPWRVPYYLLLVGSPERIPFDFSRLLSVEYAVGRLHFDTVPQYTDYVDSLIAYERGQAPPRGKEVVFFGTRHPSDKATDLSSELLLGPLADGAPAEYAERPLPGVVESLGFCTRKEWGENATKSTLAEILAPADGAEVPVLLFTATHGLGFSTPQLDQSAKQGALVCRDWPGFGRIADEHYFAATDVPPGSKVHGLITFHFASFGAGTPAHDQFLHEAGEPPPQIADRPFVAALPKALLSHPQGGALACIGQVGRSWGYSTPMPAAGGLQILPYRNAIARILAGEPVGFAVKDFRERFAAMASSLSALLEEIEFGGYVSDRELVASWIERNDAGSYAVLGDPAARLHGDADRTAT